MKKIIYLILSLIFFTLSIQGQTCDDVIATAKTTESSCQSNGSIEVILSGTSVPNLTNIQYSLVSTTGSLSLGPVSNNVFNNLPAGNYNIEVSGNCNNLGGSKVVRTIQNVQVKGSYTEPILTFVAPGATSTSDVPTSRKSYAGCSTGVIVLSMKGGNQMQIPTFTITSAPSGVTVPQNVGVTKATTGSSATGWRYLLDGDSWPGGVYTIAANDGCYSSVSTFTLEELTSLPQGYFGSSGVGSGNLSSGCSIVSFYGNFMNITAEAFPDFYRYLNDHLYEYTIASADQTPKDDSWCDITAYPGSSRVMDKFDVSPNVYSSFYQSKSLIGYTRLKKCTSTFIKSSSFKIDKPTSYISTTTTAIDVCNGINRYEIRPLWTGAPVNPITTTITDILTGDVVYNNSGSGGSFQWVCNPGEKYQLRIVDACGYVITNNYSLNGGTPNTQPPLPSFRSYTAYDSDRLCDSYRRWVTSTYPCVYGDINISVSDETGTVLETKTLSPYGSNQYGSVFFDNLQYDVTYTYTFVYTASSGLTKTLTDKIYSYTPTGISLKKESVSPTTVCSEKNGKLRIDAISSDAEKNFGYFRKGTTVTVVGPEGYVSQSYTKVSDGSSSDSYIMFPETELPAGEYTATVVSCGQTFVYKANIGEGYVVGNLDYTEDIDCMGTKIFPTGSITNDGTPYTPVYYRIVKAPSGSVATSKVIKDGSGDYFLFTTPGTYVLGIMTGSTITSCALKTIEIEYAPPAMSLDTDYTSAYACPTGDTGYLTIQATNGTAPYTYTLYDVTNTTQLLPPVVSSTAVSFDYGKANETYNIRVSDACGNEFVQEITLIRLDQAALIYGDGVFCYGSTIRIIGFTVSDATYSWTGPNGFTSSSKNIEIPNATKLDEGWYSVKIYSNKCDFTVEDKKYITVNNPVNVVDLHNKTQEITICPLEGLSITQKASGGSGVFTYQWGYSTDGVTYIDLQGETNPTIIATSSDYLFTDTKSSPSRRYLRLTIDDGICDPYTLYYHTNTRGCMFLVNPDLRSPASK